MAVPWIIIATDQLESGISRSSLTILAAAEWRPKTALDLINCRRSAPVISEWAARDPRTLTYTPHPPLPLSFTPGEVGGLAG